MKKLVTLLTCLISTCGIQAQKSRIDIGLKKFDMTFKTNENYPTVINKKQPVCNDKDCKVKSLLFTEMPLSLENKDGQCRVYADIPPLSLIKNFNVCVDSISHTMKYVDPDTVATNDPSENTYDLVKWNLKRGGKGFAKKYWEYNDIKCLFTFLPQAKARELFNADYLCFVPLDFKGETCQGKYTNARCVVFGKYEKDIVLYFFMTDNSAKKFYSYLDEMKDVFRFNQ